MEFKERAVFFTMAKVLSGRTCWFSAEFSSYSSPIFDRYDDERVMEFIPMQLSFFDGPSGESSPQPPIFSRVTEFRVTGVVGPDLRFEPGSDLNRTSCPSGLTTTTQHAKGEGKHR